MKTMLNLYIPALGQELKLIQDWTFTLHAEDRNKTLGEKLGYKVYDEFFLLDLDRFSRDCVWVPLEVSEQIEQLKIDKWKYDRSKIKNFYKENTEKSFEQLEFTLPAGTVLKVARIYIRQGNGEFDSITFNVVSHPAEKKYKARFWVKLKDANKILCETEIES